MTTWAPRIRIPSTALRRRLGWPRRRSGPWPTWITDPATVLLDCETTGLGPDDQVIELAIVAAGSGRTLWHSRIRPTVPVDPAAQAVHGISAADLEACPTWADIHREIAEVLTDRTVVTYNAEFDRRLIHQSAAAAGVPAPPVRTWRCAMRAYRRRCPDGRRMRLSRAARREGLEVNETVLHGALADTVLLRDLIRVCADTTTAPIKETAA